MESNRNKELYIPLQGKYTTNPEENLFDLTEKIKEFFVFDETNPSDPKVMLLLGDAGSGKSVFAQQLFHQLTQVRTEKDPAPLWVPLPELLNPFAGAVEEILKKQEFSESQIAQMKAKKRFIFIVDGYDELHQFQNCYVTNKWSTWNAKVLITCRSQALYYQKDYEKFFIPFNGEQRLPLLLRKLYVAPFSREQISAYVKQYQFIYSDHKIAEEDFSKVPGLTELITTPFLLHLAVESLSDILASQQHHEKNPAMTQAALYDVFIERWFTRQIEKLRTTGHFENDDIDPKPQLWNYCKKLAQQMHEKAVSVIPYQVQKSGGRLFVQRQKNSWDSFFNEESEVVRSACPLRRYGDHYYGFMHSSMIEYFATRAMYEEIQNNKIDGEVNKEKENDSSFSQEPDQLGGGIFQRLFTLERQAIQFLADRVQMSEAFKQKMLQIVEASKNSSHYAIGAANAITALVRGGVTFNGADLSRIKISGADISGGYFDRANLKDAELKQVRLTHTWLRQVVMHGCQLEGLYFGEYPWTKFAERVNSIAYRPDLDLLVAGGGDDKLSICKGEEMDLVNMFSLAGRVKSVSISLDGKRLASGCGETIRVWGKDRVLRDWDVTNDVRNIVLADMNDTLTLNASGVWIIESQNKTVQIFNYAECDYVVLSGHESCVNSIAMSADGLLVVSGSNDRTVRIWKVDSSECNVLTGHEAPVNGVAMCADGQRVVSGSDDKTVRVWEVMDGKCIVLSGHKAAVNSVAMSADGNRVASGSVDYTVRVWDVIGEKCIVLSGHEAAVNSIAMSADGNRVASGSDDKTVRVWEVMDGKCIVLSGHERFITSVALSVDSLRLASASDDKTVRVWDVESGQSIVQRGHEGSIISVVLNADDQRIVSASKDRTVRAWNMLTGEYSMLYGYEGPISSASFSADGRRVVIGGRKKTVTVSDFESGKSFRLSNHQKAVTSVALSMNGQVVVSGSENETVRITDITKGKCTTMGGDEGHVTSVALSEDGQHAVLGRKGGTIVVWDMATTNSIVLGGHSPEDTSSSNSAVAKVLGRLRSTVTCLAVSINGQCVVSGGVDQTVRVSDVSSGCVLVLEGHHSCVTSVALSKDRQCVVSGGLDKTVRIWDMAKPSQAGVINLHSCVSSISYDHALGALAVGLANYSVQLWQRMDNLGAVWQLVWSTSKLNSSLFLEGCDVSGSKGLSRNNMMMMSQRGATIVLKSKIQPPAAELLSEVGNHSGSPIHLGGNSAHQEVLENNEQEDPKKCCVLL